MGMVFRNEDGTQELKDQGCSDFFINVGSFQVELINPDSSAIILVDYNGSTQILAQNTNGNANYSLYVVESKNFRYQLKFPIEHNHNLIRYSI